MSHKTEIAANGRRWHIANKERLRDYRISVKTEVLIHYGNGKLACVKCGYDKDIRALSIDHIYGGGCQHRKIMKISAGIQFYCMLKDTYFPEGYQTLCMNCQQIKKEEDRQNNQGVNQYCGNSILVRRQPNLL